MTDVSITTPDEQYGQEYRATYSPDDNKLRLYARHRLDEDTYAKVSAAGYKWAPKQKFFVAPAWTPAREDLALSLAGEIEDEDSTLLERQEDNLTREIARQLAASNWLALGIKNELRQANILSGQQLALAAKAEYAPQLQALSSQMSAGVSAQ